jgi:hypothetical protein
MGDAGRLPFMPRRVGSFWRTHKPQVDVVAINEDDHAILLGECKWTNDPVDKSVVVEHIAKTEQVTTDSAQWKVFYIFFSKSGFTLEAKKAAASHPVFWVDLKQLERDLQNLSR